MPLSRTAVYEPHSPYSAFPMRGMVYEISLRVRDSSDHFQDLYQSHRLVQTLLKGQMLDLYNMRDFVLWPNGLFLRISLKGFATLSEFFDFLKKQSLYPGVSPGGLWEDDIDWIQVIPPERMVDSDRRFLDRAEHLRTKLRGSKGGDPSLFFFYRDPSLSFIP